MFELFEEGKDDENSGSCSGVSQWGSEFVIARHIASELYGCDACVVTGTVVL